MESGDPGDANSRVVDIPDDELQDVKEEDRGLIKDVLCVMDAMQHPARLIKNWTVQPVGSTHYDVLGQIDTRSGDWEIYVDDLDIIRQVDRLRVSSVSVKIAGQSASIRVKVIARSERVMSHEYDIIRVTKRSKWLF